MLSRRLPGLLLATLGCSFVLASPPPEAWNAPYPEKTAALAAKGDAARGASAFEICQGCHRVGALGRPDGSYPRLAGQHATVLIKQLTDVRSERRGNAKMLPFADHQALSVQPRDDVPANTVVVVVQKGYTLNGRLVRPAMVMVSRAAEGGGVNEKA